MPYRMSSTRPKKDSDKEKSVINVSGSCTQKKSGRDPAADLAIDKSQPGISSHSSTDQINLEQQKITSTVQNQDKVSSTQPLKNLHPSEERRGSQSKEVRRDKKSVEEDDDDLDAQRQAPNRDPEYNRRLWQEKSGLFVPDGYDFVLKEDLQALKLEIDILKDRNNELSNRLIKRANIEMEKDTDECDLNDLNRPTNLCEKFGELYMNEWALAFDSLGSTDGDNCEEIIQVLIQILHDAFMFCQSETRNDMEKVAKAVFLSVGGEEKDVPNHRRMEDMEIEQEMLNDEMHAIQRMRMLPKSDHPEWSNAMKHAREIRKDMVSLKLPAIAKEFLEQEIQKLAPDLKDKKEIIVYIKLCIKLCWLMCIQSPPMYLHFVYKDDNFNTNIFNYYQEKGKYVKYCVWPALFRNQSGALYSKGLAAGKKKSDKADKK